MADDFATVEAPELEVGGETTETVDTGADVTAEPETAETTTETDAEVQPGQLRPVENGRLSPAAKAALDQVKATDPKLAASFQKALFLADRVARELPGGFKEVQQLKQTIEQLGGEQGIQEFQQELGGWRDFDEQFTAGDPKVLEFLTGTPEAKDAFLKIAPLAFDRFAKIHPDGYNSYISQVFLSDMVAEQLPLALERMKDFIGENPKALEAWNKVAGYFNRISELAKKPAAAPASVAPVADDGRAKEFETRDQNLRKQEWKAETDKQHAQIFNQAWTKFKTSIPPKQEALVRRLYGFHLNELLTNKKDFTTNLSRFFQAKQKDGFLRTHEAAYKEAVPLAIRRAMAEAGIGPAKAPVAAVKPGQVPTAKPAPTGWTRVNQKPTYDQYDKRLTTADMVARKQAILKDGKRVTWA